MKTKNETELKADMKEALDHLFYTDLAFADLGALRPPRSLEVTRLTVRVEEACEQAIRQDGLSAEQVRDVLRDIISGRIE